MNPTWLVAYDFSESAEEALNEAARELVARQGRIVLLHVLDLAPAPVTLDPLGGYGSLGSWEDVHAQASERARASLQEAAERVERTFPGVDCDPELRVGHAAEAVLEAATQLGVDRIVVGTHGRTGIKRALLGSVAERVVRLASVPVLVVRRAAPSPEA